MLAAPDTLPRSYWRSRFCVGQEYDFLFLKHKASRDWCSLFFGTRRALKWVLSVVNRKRIRRILESIASHVELQAAQQNGLHGYVLRQSSRNPGYQRCPDRMAVKLVGTLSGQVITNNKGRLLHDSCCVLHFRGLPLMPPRQHQWIGISTIKLGTRTFISGINLSQQKKAGLVGYHMPASEKWIEILPCKSRLESIRVAFCSTGPTGIEFVFENSHTSGWVGDNSGPGIAQGTLSIPESIVRSCLVASLDNLKIVSLSIGRFTESTEVPYLSRHMAQDGSDSSFVQSNLWTSHSPSEKRLSISEIVPFRSVPAFDPLTNVDFGGPEGRLLGTLTRMTFYMESSPNPLTGIETFYTDSSPLLFGSRGGCEISCFVNGSKGERITQIGAFDEIGGYWSRDNREDGLIGLQVSTNYGRIATIVPLPDRLNASVELIPISPPSDTITGFVFRGKAYKNRFTRVGCQSQKCDQPTTPDELDRKFHHIPDDQVRYDKKATHFIDGSVRGCYQTYASLKNVRSIQASIGAQGRARAPGYISGLKIEYHNHPSPDVLGQWISELDDVFEVSPDEDIHSLSVWLAPVGFSKECRGVQISQVAAIQIETTHSRSVTFRSPEYQPRPDDLLHHRYERQYGEDITAISWILNIRSDYIRAVVSSKAQSTPKLVPGPFHPFDQTQKIYFERKDGDGEKESLVKAEAYFRTKRIVGLLFTYSSGSTASIGDLDTPSRQTVHFKPDSRIIGLSVAGDGDTLVEIEFQAESNEGPSSEKFKASFDSPRDPASNNTNTNLSLGKEDWRATWCTNAASAQKCRAERRSFIDKVPEVPADSKMVGLYAGSHRFSTFGVMYV